MFVVEKCALKLVIVFSRENSMVITNCILTDGGQRNVQKYGPHFGGVLKSKVFSNE